MTELTFTAGTRATIDLRGSEGTVVVQDWDGATIKIVAEGETPPYVLRDTDTFRVRLEAGGSISVPSGLLVEVVAPPSVHVRVQRSGGETELRAAVEEGSGSAGASGRVSGAGPADFADFADLIAEQGKRILHEVSRATRFGAAGAATSAATGVSDEVARKLDEVADRIDDQARRVAERIQKEVERAVGTAERYEGRARDLSERLKDRAERRAERHATRDASRAERHAARAERHATHAGRGGRDRWSSSAQPAASASSQPSKEERLAIMQMLQDGKITAEQAAQLLDALG